MDEWINTNGTYDGIDDFTVVMQPYMRDMPPRYTVNNVLFYGKFLTVYIAQ